MSPISPSYFLPRCVAGDACPASPLTGNQSSAISRLSSALALYPALSCSRRLCLPALLETRSTAGRAVSGRTMLAEVRHERGQNTAKSLGISLGNGRVCTTFAIEFEPLGEAEAELLEERFLLGSRFGDTA